MIQFKILSGKKAGTEVVARHFPFWVGRSPNCQLSLDDAGVWDRHFHVDLNDSEGFTLASQPDTSVVLDGKSVRQSALRNGDVIEVGLAKISFSLSPTKQKSLTLREWITWIGLGFLCLAQVAFIYHLLA